MKNLIYDTVDSMLSDKHLAIGVICCTKGFYMKDDGGSATYKIDFGSEPNGIDVFRISDICCAYLVSDNDSLSIDALGARGDGVSDDTRIVQYAVEAFDEISFNPNKVYVLNKIIISRQVSLDFCGCTLICKDKTLFSIECDFDREIYIGPYLNDSGIGFNADDGLLYVSSKETVHAGRKSYYGGMACISRKGILNCNLPYTLSKCKVFEQSGSVSGVVIRNIADILFKCDAEVDGSCKAICLSGVYDCLIENINFTCDYYYGIYISRSSRISVRNCTIRMILETNTTLINSYGIGVVNGSTYTNIENCVIYSNHWHCITTGGDETNLYTTIRYCNLFAERNDNRRIAAYADHANTIGTHIEHSVIQSCIHITDGVIDDCLILCSSLKDRDPLINLSTYVGDYYHSNYILRNIRSADERNIRIRFTASINYGETYLISVPDIIFSNCANIVISMLADKPNEHIASIAFKHISISKCKNVMCHICSLVFKMTILESSVLCLDSSGSKHYRILYEKSDCYGNDLVINNSDLNFSFGYNDVIYDNLVVIGSRFHSISPQRFHVMSNCIVFGSILTSRIDFAYLNDDARYYIDCISAGVCYIYKDKGKKATGVFESPDSM